MAILAGDNALALNGLKKQLEHDLPTCPSLAAAGQRCTDLVYDTFRDSVVLTRVFLSLPFEKLGGVDQDFVSRLANSKNVGQSIHAKTPVLSLLGTRGREPQWNDRLRSAGHLGIPLVSADFVDAIPMISRLLRDLRVSMEWLSGGDEGVHVQTQGTLSGVFYVEDASTVQDSRGRNVIADQKFVKDYKVKTVFGVGGQYILQRMCVILVVFCQDSLKLNEAEAFIPVANLFKAATAAAVSSGRIYS